MTREGMFERIVVMADSWEEAVISILEARGFLIDKKTVVFS